MERRTYIYISLITFVIVFFVALFYFILSGKPSASPQKISELEECKVLEYNGENALNFVIFGTKSQAEKYSEYMLNVKPYDEFKENFNFFYIEPGQYDASQGCKIYKGIAILCNERDLIKKAGSCPNDYIIVLQEKSASIRSSAFNQILSINSVHPLTVLIHELGHGIAKFAEEYVDDSIKIPRESRNCAADCAEFDGIEEGCFLGCSDDEHYRSVENGVMRTLSPPEKVMYGTFNENFMREKLNSEIDSLFSKITGSISRITGRATDFGISCEDEHYFLGEYEYDSEAGLTLTDSEFVQGCYGSGSMFPGEFAYNLLDEEGEIIFSKSFDIEFHTVGPGEEVNGLIQIEHEYDEFETFILKAPVTADIPTWEIVDPQGRYIQTSLIGTGGRACKI
ncbi:hypothetical protein J4462_03905 [Candidatus Pacearchaeota archaeon]|nr:hypothetical protein [Candidatus Pacearchaeota archaeon]